jgi:hypothetical protein
LTPPSDQPWTIRLDAQANEWLDSVSEVRAYSVLDILREWVPKGPPEDSRLVETDAENGFRYRTPDGNIIDFVAVTYERLILVKRIN